MQHISNYLTKYKNMTTQHRGEFRVLAGITKDNELYFLEIDPTNDKRNGYDEFSMN